MLKDKIMTIFSTIAVGLAFFACTNDDANDGVLIQKKFPLTAFAVKVGDSYYNGKIDQITHRVEIGTITNSNSITEVSYDLFNSEATITPAPSTFVNNWKKEQQVTVTTADKAETTYTIVLTKYVDADANLLFKDDFNVDGTPDPSKWVLCKKETSDWNDEMSESYDQAYVKDGNLVLKAEKVNGNYLAGGIESLGKFDFTFGKVEVRARLTKYPDGAFPAIWMMPKKYAYPGWPNAGEIDIMEHVKQESAIHQTIHTNYTYNLHLTSEVPNTKATVCNYGDYNVYGMEWTADKLTFYVNGVETFNYPNLKLPNEAEVMQWPFTKDASFYLILNMGLGGNREGSWAGPIDDDNLPAVMEIDWVRVSKLEK